MDANLPYRRAKTMFCVREDGRAIVPQKGCPATNLKFNH
jgi:hypothetical protein